MLDLSIIIVNWNTRQMLNDSLESIIKTVDNIDYEIIVVDNGSTDGSQAMLQEKYSQVRLIANRENVGFAGANNQAMEIGQGRYFLLWNSDAFATPGSIQALFHLAETEPKAGLVGAQLRNTDGSFQASCTPFPNLWQEFLILSGLGRALYGPYYPSRGPQEEKGGQLADYVEGACMLVRREAYAEVGGLDEGYFMYAEEVDWCYAMKEKGWQVWYQPQAKVIHVGGGSSVSTAREANLYRGRVRFFQKHYGPRAANGLKWLIYLLTAIKSVVHSLLRRISGGRYGRPVVSLRHLVTKLREI